MTQYCIAAEFGNNLKATPKPNAHIGHIFPPNIDEAEIDDQHDGGGSIKN